MRWVLVALTAIVTLTFVSAASAQAPRRVALVIANSSYASVGSLRTPANDARLVSDALRRSGFAVTTQLNLDNSSMRAALQRFRSSSEGAEAAVIYYSGHGIEAAGKNWLIPVDAELKSDVSLPYEAVDVDAAISSLSSAKVRILILDACRDNPFGRSWQATRSLNRGLAALDADGTLVMLSAAPGQVASDGNGSTSPFAAALARRIPEAELPIQFLGERVRDDVLQATGGRQRPMVSSSIAAEPFYLVPPRPAAAANPETLERLRLEQQRLEQQRMEREAAAAERPSAIEAERLRREIELEKTQQVSARLSADEFERLRLEAEQQAAEAAVRAAAAASAGRPKSQTSEPLPTGRMDDYRLERLRFNKPQSMKINRPYVVEAQIGMRQIQSLGDVGPTVSRSVEVPNDGGVRVELISDQLNVEKLHAVDTLVLAPGKTGLWSWRVTPNQEGRQQRMLLQVYASRPSDATGEVLVETYRETVLVDVSPLDRAEMYGRAFIKQWEIVAGVGAALAALGGLISFVLGRRRKAVSK